jgi:hypothetical protein
MPDPFGIERAHLRSWADRFSAASEFPRLIRRLILETGTEVVGLAFPAEEGVAAGDWDGSVRSGAATAHIAAGLSVWELSVRKDVGTKAEEDYEKRTTTPDGTPTTEATYVAAVLRPWTKRAKWAREKSEEGRWAEVRAYGIDDVATWLEGAPVTSAWFADLLGLGPFGMRSVDTWWRRWAGSTSPPMPDGLLLAGRDPLVASLKESLVGPARVTTIAAPSIEEVEAFLAAFAIGLPEEESRVFARMAFVDQVSTWRALEGSDRPLILVPTTEEVRKEIGGGSRHHVLVPVIAGASADLDLPAIDPQAARDALKETGVVDDDRAEGLGYLARRSLLGLRRSLAVNPALHSPAWAKPPADRTTRGALLAGRWNGAVPGDQEVIEELAALGGEDLREALDALAVTEDPLVGVLDRSWALTGPFDAWLQLRGQLRDEDLKRLEQAVRTVLLEVDPALSMAPENRWKAGLEGKTSAYGPTLRLGLAESILLLAINGAEVAGGRGADCASYLVHVLGEEANKDTGGSLWASLGPLLPRLAEAAPRTFLESLREAMAGDSPVIAALFADPDGQSALFTAGSPHTYLLWALETLAWSDEHFGATVDALARLAEIDPGGNLSNRPAESLARIFCPWHPENAADNSRRLTVIDALRDRHPAVAWPLMLSMLPESMAHHFPTAKPTYRDWVPPREQVPYAEYFELAEAIAERLAEDAGASADRWAKLITEGRDLPPRGRAMIRAGISARIEEFDADARGELWEAVRAFIANHREYADADWALGEDELKDYDDLLARLSPTEASERLRYLFDEHHPGLTSEELEDLAAFESELEKRRAAALGEIEAEGGPEAVLELARGSQFPGTVGWAAAAGTRDRHDATMLGLLGSDDPADRTIAGSYFSKRLLDDGWDVLGEEELDPAVAARLLLAGRDLQEAWKIAEARGGEVEDAYWSEFSPYGLGADFPHLGFAARKLFGVGRAAACLRLIGLYLRKDAVEDGLVPLIADALDALLASWVQDEGTAQLEGLGTYDFAQLFKFLEEHRDAIGNQRLGQLEWGYLGALGHEPFAPTLYRALADDPAFFLEVVSALYKPASADRAEPNEAERKIADNGYRLLSSWHQLPGATEDEGVDEKALLEWCEKSRELLAAADRKEIGELQIGAVLAYAPADPDGSWPIAAVRNVLEKLDSRAVERGMRTAKYNSRGVVSKSVDAGGESEHELANEFERFADAFRDRWPRSTAVLRDLADGYRREARRGGRRSRASAPGFRPLTAKSAHFTGSSGPASSRAGPAVNPLPNLGTSGFDCPNARVSAHIKGSRKVYRPLDSAPDWGICGCLRGSNPCIAPGSSAVRNSPRQAEVPYRVL